MLHRIFSHHPDVSFLTTVCNRWPHRPRNNARVLRMMGLPLIGPLIRRRFHPDESWRFWSHYVRGFNRPPRDLRADDVRPNEAPRIRHALREATASGRPRLLVKITGWPRAGFLHELYADARFVHISRDPRAVVNSFINAPFWEGWRGPQQWRWGPLDAAEQEEWERHDLSFVALAAIQWKKIMRAMEQARRELPPESLLELRYEDFASNTQGGFARILNFCGLGFPASFARFVSRYPVRSANYKWKEDLSAAQQAILESCIRPLADSLGYGRED